MRTEMRRPHRRGRMLAGALLWALLAALALLDALLLYELAMVAGAMLR